MSFVDDDLDCFFDDFGTTALVNGVSISGIFDKDYASLDFASGIQSNSPQFECLTSDAVNIALSDTIKIDSTTYTIVEIKADGTGMTVLRLHE